MDNIQLVAFLSPMLDHQAVAVDSDGDTYGPPICPELNSYLKARLGALCPQSSYEAVLLRRGGNPGAVERFDRAIMPRRHALALILREAAEALLAFPSPQQNPDWIAQCVYAGNITDGTNLTEHDGVKDLRD